MAIDVSIDKHRALAGHPLFGQLSAEERERLVTYMRISRFKARTTLFEKGDPGSSMMLVLRGSIKICTHSEEGKELVFRLITQGGFFGEIALLDGRERTAAAVTLEEGEMLVLERRDFIPFLERHPDACLRLMAVLCERLRTTSELVEEVLFLEGEARLAKRFVYLADKFGRDVGDGVRIERRLSQTQLGNMVGMSRESINKQLGQWRREELVRDDDGFYTITDMDRLREM
jgi:CRP/FNR family cyclic AMP-dependent transcriptional regulator